VNVLESKPRSDSTVYNLWVKRRRPLSQTLISVVIPAFNEGKTLENVIERTKHTLNKIGHLYEIIVVDDGSTDQTCNVAPAKEVIIVRNHKNHGKGYALKMGFDHCRGDIIVTLDADGSHQPEELTRLVQPIMKNRVDMIIGSRFNTQLEDGAIKRVNMIGNKLFNLLIFLLSRRLLTDTQSGFRAFNRKVLSNLNVRSTGYEIESEITVELIQKGFTISEVPITCSCPPRNSRLSAFHDGYKILKTIVSTYLRWM